MDVTTTTLAQLATSEHCNSYNMTMCDTLCKPTTLTSVSYLKQWVSVFQEPACSRMASLVVGHGPFLIWLQHLSLLL